MKVSIPTTLFLILINAISAFGLGQKEELCKGLHPGVHIYKYHWDKEQCVFYVAEIDRKSSNVHVQVCIGQDKVLGKETVPSIAQRKSKDGKKSLVAINGGFGVLGDFGGLAGISHNLFVQDGELISGPIPEDVCFGVTRDGRFLMGYPRMEASVIFTPLLPLNSSYEGSNRNKGSNGVNNQKIPIEAINNRMRGDQRRDYNSILYTPRFDHSTHTNDRVYEAVITGAQLPLIPKYQSDVVLTSMGKEGDREIPPNGFVLSVRPRIYDDPSLHSRAGLFSQLQKGQQGKVEIRLEPDEWNDVVQAIGGNYALVEDGKLSKFMKEVLLSDDGHKPGRRRNDKVISHEPRTALGFNDEKLFLIVVDGRQEGYSTGMTMYEVGQVLIELGAKQAMNLDGGASSTFFADGEVLNRPSGGDLRKVLNAVLIMK